VSTTFLKSNNNNITGFAAAEGIQFKFIFLRLNLLERLWEAGVKSAKHHLTKILDDKHLTFEELSTLFTQIAVNPLVASYNLRRPRKKERGNILLFCPGYHTRHELLY
jgi:hypothetical protein